MPDSILCQTNTDYLGLICPMLIGYDTPQCHPEKNVCFCGPKRNFKEIFETPNIPEILKIPEMPKMPEMPEMPNLFQNN